MAEVEVKRVKVRGALSKSGLYDLDYAYNPYAGCSHNCLYCYARYYTPFREVSENWGRIVYVKSNVLEALSRDVKRCKRGVVGVSTITDPYQPIEASEELTRRGLEILLKEGFRASIQTKSPLVLRDLDLLSRNRHLVDAGLTITTLDQSLAKLIEPGAPPPLERVRALKILSENRIETWVFLGPIIRGVNDSDSNIRRVAEVALETGSKLIYDYFRFKPGMEKQISPLTARYPECINAPPSWRKLVRDRVEEICDELGVVCEPAFPGKEKKRDVPTRLTDFY